MTVKFARSAGFCFGVAHAVHTVYREMENKTLVTLGPLIHNKTVTDELASRGVRSVGSLDEVKDETAVIRSHGIPPHMENALREKNITYIDCTCACVKTVHNHAAKASEKGRAVIIAGEESHPEVAGIMGYAGEGAVVVKEAEQIIHKVNAGKKYVLVAQTTFEREAFEKIISVLKKENIDIEYHDTICGATGRRQAEAAELARESDVMIILGDKNSANTTHLFEIARKYCPRTVLIPSIRDLELPFLRESDKIGVTAGASTPPAIIKEAVQFMSDIAVTAQQTEVLPTQSPVQTTQAAESFEEMLNESFVSLHNGDIVKGTVIHVTNNEVTVNLGYKSDGIITRSEMTDDAAADITQLVKPGDVFDVYVLRVNDGEGNVLVSKKRLDNQVNYKMLEQAWIDKTPVPGKVTEVVKGGLMALIYNCRVFIPSSQISNRFVDDLNSFKGKELNFHILEFDRSKRRIVAGRKELANAEQQQRRDELFSALEIGQRIEGVVSRIVEFGAFVDLGGVDGLIHISELAWKRVRKVADILQAGDPVTVTVIDINPEKNKISLTLKDINNNPWNGIEDKYPIGSVIQGKVVRLAAFGAFVNLEDGVDGLVHISQIADRHVVKPDDELAVGQIIDVKVIDVDAVNNKISLSKREADIVLAPDVLPGEEPAEEEATDTAEAPHDEATEPAVAETLPDEAAETAEVEILPDEAAEPAEVEALPDEATEPDDV